jgi:aminoglycoside phosphotransferase (APT) family kinase protein
MRLEDDQPELAAWIEATTGGEIVSAQRQGRWRVHWMVDVDTPTGRLELLARMPRDPEFIEHSAFLRSYRPLHEALVLQAMEPTTIPTPRFFGFHEPTQTQLIERVGGSGDFRELDELAAESVLLEYVEHLVAIHELPLAVFANAALPTPDPSLPGGQLQWMRQDFEAARLLMQPEPLLEFALWWLEHHLPADRARRSIVQGDTGPGQFMFEGTELIALIDWELADIDHPMLDLGVMRMRNTLYPMGRIDAALEHYAHMSGRPLDLEAIRYFTVVASLVSLLGMAQSMQAPSAAVDSMLPRLAWDVVMRRTLCEALLEANGLTPDAPELPDPAPTSRTPLHSFLIEHLEVGCASLATDDYGSYLLGGAVGLARALQLLDQIGPQLDDADLDDMGTVLGSRPQTLADGNARLAKLVETEPEPHLPELLQMWYRIAVRREYGRTPLMVAQGSGPLTPMPDDLGQDVSVAR